MIFDNSLNSMVNSVKLYFKYSFATEGNQITDNRRSLFTQERWCPVIWLLTITVVFETLHRAWGVELVSSSGIKSLPYCF